MDDDTLSYLSHANTAKLRANWQAIFEKYNQPFADDDEIFLPNLTIAKDNGFLRKKVTKRRAIGKSKFAVETHLSLVFPANDSAVGTSRQSSSEEINITRDSKSKRTPRSVTNATYDISDDDEGEVEPSDAETISSESSWSSVTADDSTDDEVSDEQRCLSNDWSSASRTTQDGTEWRGRTVDRPQRLRPVGSPVTVKSGLVADASSSARLRRRIVPVPCDGDVTNRRCASGGQGAAAAAAAAGAMVESSNVVALNETYDLPPENQVCREFKKLTASERSATETLTAFRDHSFERAGAKSTEGDSISAPPPPLTRSFVVIEPSCGGGAVVIAEDLSLPAFAPVRSPATTTASARMLMNATPSRQAEIREEFNRLRTRSTNGVRERKSPEVVGTHARASHVACACGNCANNNRCKAIEISSRPVVTANLLPPPTASVDSRASCVHCGGQWRDADRNWAVLPSCGSADGNGTGAPRCGPADRAANGIATSWPPAAAAGASSPSQTSEEVERLPCCDSSTPTRIDAPALNISFLSSIHDAWSAPVSPAITASGRKTRVRRNLAASAAAAAAAAGDGDDRQPTKFDFGVADYSEKRLSHRSPSVKRMWHDLSPSSESENDVDRTLADELLKVERSVRMRMQSHLSANNAVFCPGTGRCTKSTCFACQ